MSYTQLVAPNTNATDDTGMCLRFVQRVFQNRNPFYYNSATQAWQNTVHKSYERNLPTDVMVAVWFSHWGTYGDPPLWDDWGHVVAGNPAVGYLSSPTWGSGSQWFPSIEAIERAFNCRFVGWSLDVGGLTVAWPNTREPNPVPALIIEEDPMPIRESLRTFNPKLVAKPGTWTTVKITDKGGVTLIQSGKKGLQGTLHTVIHATGEFHARYVYDDVKGGELVKRTGSVSAQYDREGIHGYPFSIPAGGDRRLRIQVKPTGKSPITVTAVAGHADYWEK